MNNYDRVIKNARIVCENEVIEGDLAILDGKIVAIGTLPEYEVGDTIDASGMVMLPGGVDVHTHLDMPLTDDLSSSDDFESGSIAAAIGGTTCFVDYACQPGDGTLADGLNTWKKKAEKSCLDYGLHMSIVRPDDATLSEMGTMIDEGVTSFKVYLVYDMRVSDEELMKILTRAKELGGLVSVHCENYGAIKFRTDKLIAEGKCEPKYHAQSRPDLCEAEAVDRVIKLAAMCDSPVYIVHNSCMKGIKRVEDAIAEGLPVIAETCPQYLMLTENKYNLPDFEGAKFVMSPPLRKAEDREYLWEMIKSGVISVISTDHCPFFFEDKKRGLHNFSQIPNGAPGIEARMALIFSEGLRRGLTLNKIADLTATNPAKTFGLYPQKGAIRIGADADLVLFDADKSYTMKHSILHENVDYTGYEGIPLKGKIMMTIANGEVIAKKGEYVGKKGRGKFIRRSLPIM